MLTHRGGALTIRSIPLLLQRRSLLAAIAVCGLFVYPVPAWGQVGGELSRFVRWIDTLALEETEDVIHVAPILALDGSRGFIIADPREAQVRLYDRTGALVHRFGRTGGGPGEYRAPMAAGRCSTNEIWVADITGRITLYNPSADSVLRTIQTPIMPTYGAVLIDDSSLLVIGRVPGEDHLLHVLDLTRGEVARRFFPVPAGSAALGEIAHIAGFADVAVRADTIAAVFAFADTIALFNARGDRIETVPIRFQRFRTIPQDQPLPRSPGEFRKYRELFSTVTSIDWLPDGSFLVQYTDIVEGDQVITLVHLDRRGRPLFELRDTPRLLAIADGKLFFIRPGAELPNQIAIGVMSR